MEDKSLIPNTQIEEMFLRVCSDDQMQKYHKLVDNGHIALATAYASSLVTKSFTTMIEYLDKYGLTISEIAQRMKEKNG